MDISEATREAVGQGKCISREKTLWVRAGLKVQPTDTPDCCVVITKESSRQGWQPKAEDLMADDWWVVD